jgi:uncharacterized delta-60 repeat protein
MQVRWVSLNRRNVDQASVAITGKQTMANIDHPAAKMAMKKKFASQSAFFMPRVLLCQAIFFAGALLTLLASANPQVLVRERQLTPRMGIATQGPSAWLGGVQEEWVARYKGPGNLDDSGQAIVIDGSGSVYVTGFSEDTGTGYDYVTIKYNWAGQKEWVARYNGPENDLDLAQAIAVDDSGNVYVTGFSVGSGTGLDYATIKYNSAGQEQWVARYNGPGNDIDEGFAIAVDTSGNVYVTGESWDPGTKTDYATIKYNSAGQEQWVARYDCSAGIDNAAAIAIDSSGNVYVTGDSGSGSDYATIKYNPAGQEQWVARYNGPGNDNDGATAIATDNSGNVYVTGFSVGSGVDYDYATIKYNPMGQEQWLARYDGPGKDWDLAGAIAVDDWGNVYVTGNSVGTTYPDYDYATIKYNSAGQEQWVARYNGSGNGEDDASGLAIDGSGNVYVTGSSNGANNLPDYATIKYNSAGQEQWVARYDGPGNSYDIARAIAVDDLENVYVTGNSFGSGTDSDYATVKYIPLPVTATPTPTPAGSPRPRPTPRLRPAPSLRP